jgi:hypothetical protein
MSVTPDPIGAAQLELISSSREFIAARARRGIDVALDPQCYLNSWAPCLGYSRLRELAFGARARPGRLVARLRDAAALLRTRSAWIVGDAGGSPQGFDSLVVSWALPRDFDAEGHYRDRYLNLGSRETPATLWFLILISGQAPPQVSANVRVMHRAAHGRVRTHANALSATVAEAHEVAGLVDACVHRHGCKQLLMPYEAQPFQHAICKRLRVRGTDVTTIGYVHSSLPAVPTDYLFRDGAPDKLLVHGEGQAQILKLHLGWPAGSIEVIESLRYLRDAAVPFAGNILLPYAFDDAEFIVARVEAMLAAAAPGTMPHWKVRNHPVMAGSARHLALVARLEAIAARHAARASSDAPIVAQTLMIGATAAVIEALERGLDVIHLCTNPMFEKQCAEIWSELSVEDLAPSIYRYRLKRAGAYIQLGGQSPLRARGLGL